MSLQTKNLHMFIIGTLLFVSLLLLAGCGTPLPAATSAAGPAQPAAAVPPSSGEADLSPAIEPPPTVEAYVPPATHAPLPTLAPSPIPTPWPTLESERVVQGWGNFPRWPVMMPASDGETMALYMIEGDTARQIVVFEGKLFGEYAVRFTPFSGNRIAAPSPGGRYVACLLYNWNGGSSLELVDTQEHSVVTLYESVWDDTLTDGKAQGGYTDSMVSFIWLDEEHVIYSLLKPYNSTECVEIQQAGGVCLIPTEIWRTNLQGERQLLLDTPRTAGLLGASPDGQQVYFLRYGTSWNPGAQGGWYEPMVLDLASGTVSALWPLAAESSYGQFRLIQLPDGEQRILFNRVRSNPPVIWMLDPASGQAEDIWTLTAAEIPHMLAAPADFSYLENTLLHHTEGSIWRIDLSTSSPQELAQDIYYVWDWTAEGILIERQEQEVQPYTYIFQLLDEQGEVQGEIRFEN